MKNTQPPTHAKDPRFHLLDALRGIAAILIILRHVPEDFSRSLNFPGSFLAVDFFFCLSGFVIAFSYEKRLEGSLSFKDFLISRMTRLYPIAALGTLLGAAGLLTILYFHAALGLMDVCGVAFQVILGLLIVPDFFTGKLRSSPFPLDGVMWTLFLELIANVIYGGLVRLRLAKTKLFIFTALTSLLMLALVRNQFGSIDGGTLFLSLPVGLIRVAVSFTTGVLLHRLFRRLRYDNLHGAKALAAAIVIMGALSFALCTSLHFMRTGTSEVFVVAVFFPMLIFGGAHVRVPARLTLPCGFLGGISYPLYILHLPLMQPVLYERRLLAFAAHNQSAATVMMLAYILALILVAWCADAFYDVPIRKKIMKVYWHSG